MSQTHSRGLDVGTGFAHQLATRTPHSFPHDLVALPALSLESIAALADAMPTDSVTVEGAKKPLVSSEYVPAFTRPGEAGDRIRAIDENDTWMTLLNIEQVPAYKQLIDEHVDALARSAGIAPQSLRRRMGFVFVSSPGSVTPAHFDIEQSLLIQLRGERTLTFGRFADSSQRNDEVRRYWGGSFGRIEALPVKAADVALGPGKAVYIPPYTPHWLQNGDAASLSLTITFFNDDNENESLVQAFNEKVRRLRVTPKPYGHRPRVDRAKLAVMRTYGALRRRVKPERSTGR